MTVSHAVRPGALLNTQTPKQYDALLVLSFGGPEGFNDVMPFLENVTRGRNIPRERLEEVAEHYYHFGGVSPINAQNRALIAALRLELDNSGIDLPIYFGNRNWRPYLRDTLATMHADGIRDVLVFVTSAYSSYSGCRQYREDIARAISDLDIADFTFDKLRVFFNHPGFILPMARDLRAALVPLTDEQRQVTEVIFTAHSIPLSMARSSAYERQLNEASRLVAEVSDAASYRFAWQSRSGPPQVPWLEPDILDVLEEVAVEGKERVVVVPVGFISDHLEVIFDLDHEAADKAHELGLQMVRVPTVGTDPLFVSMIRELIEERTSNNPVRLALGDLGPWHDVCPSNCCRLGTDGTRLPTVAERT